MIFMLPRFRVTKMPEINNLKRRGGENGKKIKSSLIRNKTISIDLEEKWRPKNKCKWKKENKKEITSKKCLLKMKPIKGDKRRKKRDKGSRI